jgi:hypothetical protein
MRCRGYMEMAGRVVTTTAYAAIWRGQPGGRTSTGRRSGAHQTCLGRPTVHWSPSGVNEYLEAFPHLNRESSVARLATHCPAPTRRCRGCDGRDAEPGDRGQRHGCAECVAPASLRIGLRRSVVPQQHYWRLDRRHVPGGPIERFPTPRNLLLAEGRKLVRSPRQDRRPSRADPASPAHDESHS